MLHARVFLLPSHGVAYHCLTALRSSVAIAAFPQDDATSLLAHAAPRGACAAVAAGLDSPPLPCGGAPGFTADPR
jgi:hypothetical protein